MVTMSHIGHTVGSFGIMKLDLTVTSYYSYPWQGDAFLLLSLIQYVYTSLPRIIRSLVRNCKLLPCFINVKCYPIIQSLRDVPILSFLGFTPMYFAVYYDPPELNVFIHCTIPSISCFCCLSISV